MKSLRRAAKQAGRKVRAYARINAEQAATVFEQHLWLYFAQSMPARLFRQARKAMGAREKGIHYNEDDPFQVSSVFTWAYMPRFAHLLAKLHAMGYCVHEDEGYNHYEVQGGPKTCAEGMVMEILRVRQAWRVLSILTCARRKVDDESGILRDTTSPCGGCCRQFEASPRITDRTINIGFDPESIVFTVDSWGLLKEELGTYKSEPRIVIAHA